MRLVNNSNRGSPDLVVYLNCMSAVLTWKDFYSDPHMSGLEIQARQSADLVSGLLQEYLDHNAPEVDTVDVIGVAGQLGLNSNVNNPDPHAEVEAYVVGEGVECARTLLAALAAVRRST